MEKSGDAPWVLLACLTSSNMRNLPAPGCWGWPGLGHCLTLLLPPCQNEKELQDVVKQQEEKLLQLIDNSGEVVVCDGSMGGQHPGGLLATGPLSASLFPCRG